MPLQSVVVLPPGPPTEHELRLPARPGPISLDRISPSDRLVLAELAGNARVAIEVGTFLGGSAETMLQAMPADGVLLTVDTFGGTLGTETQAVPGNIVLEYAVSRLGPYKDRSVVIVGDSRVVSGFIGNETADLIFIDAAHDYANVKADIEAWLPKLKADGVFAGHDMGKWFRILTGEQIIEKSGGEIDRETQLHCGVIRAVIESFEKVKLLGDYGSTIWSVEKGWLRHE